MDEDYQRNFCVSIYSFMDVPDPARIRTGR
jgi:hypothetical protein